MDTNRHFPVVCFGEVFWNIQPSGAHPAGAPLLVAFHLSKLGVQAALVTKIGIDDYGEKLVNVLSDDGVSSEFFSVDYERPTGLVYANVNDHHEVVNDIVFPAAWDYIEYKNEYSDLIGNADYFVYGSLSARNKISRDTLIDLLDIAKTKVFDINLQPPHVQRCTVEYLLNKADILKINLNQLVFVTGWFSHFKSTEDRVKCLQDQFNIETVIVTLGAGGAMVSHLGKVHKHPGFKASVADTIASGDSFLAGFLKQRLLGASVDDSLVFAMATAAFLAPETSAFLHYEPAQINALINSNIYSKNLKIPF